MTDHDDLEAIRQLKARYFRMMDTKDWDGLAAVFTDDVVIDVTEEGVGVVRGVADYMPFLRQAIGDAITVHHGHMPELELTSPTTAKGIWSMEDELWWPEGSPIRHLHAYGHYHETYEKSADGWHIKTLKLTRLNRLVEPGDALAAESEIRNLVARLGHLADDGDLDEYLSLWTEDGTWERPGGDTFQGHEALLKRIHEDRASGVQGPGAHSRHVNTTLWVRVDGPAEAHAESYWIYLRDATSSPVVALTGRYVDTFRRTPDGWKFASRRIVADVN